MFDDSAIAAGAQPTGKYRDQNSKNRSQGMIEAGEELKGWFKKLLNKVRWQRKAKKKRSKIKQRKSIF